MDYQVFHDESQVNGFWHGMLLVPTLKKQAILECLLEARKNTNYDAPLGIKKIAKDGGNIYLCAQSWLTIALASLRTSSKNQAFPYFSGRRSLGYRRYHKDYQLAPINLTGAKFVLFCERDSFAKMHGHSDHASKFETTFRMGLKGGIHFLGEDENPISIRRLHFDGHEHHKRHLDHQRIATRLTSLREYCEIDKRHDLIDDRSSNHQKTNSQDFGDCQFLQLTDLLIGAFRNLLRPSNPVHEKLGRHTVKGLLDRYYQGYARMRNSRWFRSFCISQCYLENDAWKFDTVEYLSNEQPLQMSLPFFS